MNDILDLMQKGSFKEAETRLEEYLSIDYEDSAVISSLKYAKFWKPRQDRFLLISDDMERGEFLHKEWVHFLHYLESCSTEYKTAVYACKVWLFSSAMEAYKRVLRSSAVPDADLLFRMGRCLKALGDYERALEFYESAIQSKRDNAEYLAELGDCYALLNEIKASKAFFREAFFIAPESIDIDFIESDLILRLIERIRGMGYSGRELKVWIPVYAVLYGIFNVKRELRPLEYGRLKQAIYSLERELRDIRDESIKSIIVPKLLNHYLWLIDHYIGTKDSRENVEEVLRKIKLIDESVYEQLTT